MTVLPPLPTGITRRLYDRANPRRTVTIDDAHVPYRLSRAIDKFICSSAPAPQNDEGGDIDGGGGGNSQGDFGEVKTWLYGTRRHRFEVDLGAKREGQGCRQG
jgi:hypothetical protein